jgi:hypothetical protein
MEPRESPIAMRTYRIPSATTAGAPDFAVAAAALRTRAPSGALSIRLNMSPLPNGTAVRLRAMRPVLTLSPRGVPPTIQPIPVRIPAARPPVPRLSPLIVARPPPPRFQ